MGKRKERKRKKKGTFPLGITDIGRGCLGREKRMNAAFFIAVCLQVFGLRWS